MGKRAMVGITLEESWRSIGECRSRNSCFSLCVGALLLKCMALKRNKCEKCGWIEWNHEWIMECSSFVIPFFWTVEVKGSKKKSRKMWGQGESNTQPFDLESNALPLRHALLVLGLPFTHISHWCECGLWTYWLGKDEFMNCRMQWTNRTIKERT